jgi:hypothetical protein
LLLYNKKTKSSGNAVYKDGLEKHISGDNMYHIPCRIERKKAIIEKKRQNTFVSTITIEKTNKMEYIKLILDGNSRFLLDDCTVV